jgi:hypothetical protein
MQVRRLTTDDRDSRRSVPRARSDNRITAHTPRSGPPSDSPRELARAPARLIVVGWCWCRWRRGGPERALGAALASGPTGREELATRAAGCPLGVAVVKSPRLALERLQCNHSATLSARMGKGKEWEARGLESAGREGGVVAKDSMAGRALRWVGGGVE